jgi:mRNA interferase YafQ
MLNVIRTGKFKKDFALAEKRGKNIDRLIEIMNMIIKKEGYLECHVGPNWLLVYEINPAALEVTFHRTGSHSDLL